MKEFILRHTQLKLGVNDTDGDGIALPAAGYL